MLTACLAKRSKKPSSRGKNRCKSPGMVCDSPEEPLVRRTDDIRGSSGEASQREEGSEKMKRAPRFTPGRPFRIEVTGELENLVHAAHAACAGGACSRCLLVVFLDFGDQRFGGEHQAR